MFPGTVPVDPAAPLQVASCHLTRYKSWQLSIWGVSFQGSLSNHVFKDSEGSHYGPYISSLLHICIFDRMFTETCFHCSLFWGAKAVWWLMLTKITCHLPQHQIAGNHLAALPASMPGTLLTGSQGIFTDALKS